MNKELYACSVLLEEGAAVGLPLSYHHHASAAQALTVMHAAIPAMVVFKEEPEEPRGGFKSPLLEPKLGCLGRDLGNELRRHLPVAFGRRFAVVFLV